MISGSQKPNAYWVAGSEDPDGVLREVIRQDRKGAAEAGLMI